MTNPLSMSLLPTIYGDDKFPDGWGADIMVSLTSLKAGYDTVASAREDILGDVTMTEAARLIALERLYAEKVERHIPAAQAALEAAQQRTAAFKRERDDLFRPRDSAADIALASEIRAALRAMSPQDRSAQLAAARDAGDLSVLRAALSGPEFLTGVSAEARDSYKATYVAQHQPEIASYIDHAERLERTATDSLGALRSLRSKVFSQADERKIGEARNKASRASRHFH